MHETPAYCPPRHPLLRWIGEIGPELPQEAERRLLATFFTSKTPLIVGALNTIMVAGVIYAHTVRPIFLLIALCDLALLGVRVWLLRRTTKPSDLIFATGLLWVGLQGLSISVVVAGDDISMSILVLASGLAAIGGIVGRNFAAPRYAMIQVLVLDLSYKVAFCIQHPKFLPLIIVQSCIFVAMNHYLIKQHRKTAIDAILAEIQSREKAFTDPVTGLANRWRLEDVFGRMALPAVDRALLYLDLDGFKQVNDRLGHAAGDQLLREVGHRLTSVFDRSATVCRLGGDEFLVLLAKCDTAKLRELCALAIVRLATPYELETGVMARVGVSIGGVVDPTGRQTLAALMLKADRALYSVKEGAKGHFHIDEDEGQAVPSNVADFRVTG